MYDLIPFLYLMDCWLLINWILKIHAFRIPKKPSFIKLLPVSDAISPTNLSRGRLWSRCSVVGIVVLKVDGSWSKRRWDKCWARRGKMGRCWWLGNAGNTGKKMFRLNFMFCGCDTALNGTGAKARSENEVSAHLGGASPTFHHQVGW